jgi:hypothetical protein
MIEFAHLAAVIKVSAFTASNNQQEHDKVYESIELKKQEY